MLYDRIVSRTPVSGGWTRDRKYRAETADGWVCFLRIAEPARAERLREVFRCEKQAEALGIPMARPLECGLCGEGFYTLETWIDGPDAREAIPGRTAAQLYEDGVRAGRSLRLLHSIPAPADLPDWAERYNAKIDRKIAEYLACPLRYERDELLFAGIAENRALLEGRPQSFQHGDYHVGNFLYPEDGLTVIDFDRFGFGDPWEDFDRLPWCVSASPDLACGMVDGYFDGAPPERFWRLLAVYVFTNQLSSLPWAIAYGEGEIRVMREQEARVLSWYENGFIPSWYRT